MHPLSQYHILTFYTSEISVKELLKFTGANVDNLADLFNHEVISGQYLNPTYCPGATPEARLANLRTKPYSLAKFRGYKLYVYASPNPLIPTDEYYIDDEGTPNLYQGYNYYPFDQNYDGYGWIFNEQANGEWVQEWVKCVLVRPYHLLIVNYYSHLAMNANVDILALHAANFDNYITGSIENRISGIVNTSNDSNYGIVQYVKGGSTGNIARLEHWPAEGHTWRSSGAYPLYYHNWSNENRYVFIKYNPGESYPDINRVHIQINHNSDREGNLWNCQINTLYRYHSSCIWHYDNIIGGTVYKLTLSGGVDIEPGLKYRLYYHINGVPQPNPILLAENGIYKSEIVHISNVEKTTIFTAPITVTGIYLEVSAAKSAKPGVFWPVISHYDYTFCKYSFKIEEF